MGRRRKSGRDVHGWLILDKPYDFGSTEAVSKLRWLYNAKKAGHAGTLDPLATGLLPVAFGEATKTVPFVQDGLKTYRFTARWGEATSTDDQEGEVIATSGKRPTAAEIQAVLPDFTGDIEQVPPAFSAIKVDGERAYDLAREGEAPELQARTIRINALNLVESSDADHSVFEAVTGKGAYIRALVRDIAHALGTEGHVSALRRTAVGPFNEDMAITFDELLGQPVSRDLDRETLDRDLLDAELAGIGTALSDLPASTVSGGDAERLRRGQAVVVAPPVAKGIRGGLSGFIPAVFASCHDEPVAICALDGLKLKPVKVFNLT
ncbi:MAG: tRNA pseudouridine(55) synthase TruB [Aquisalinus sp.]|nr:tRNA pseudouridine(55) synthase TruB [Aquisalinus sp.]